MSQPSVTHREQATLQLVYWSVAFSTAKFPWHGRICRTAEYRPSQNQEASRNPDCRSAMGRKLLDVIVYGRSCRIGGKLSVNDLVEASEVGDWKMPSFKVACTYAASQRWLIVADDTLTLTTAGLAAA